MGGRTEKETVHLMAAKEAKQELMLRRRERMESGNGGNGDRVKRHHLKAVKSQLMEVKRGRNLLSQSKTAATPSQTPKRRQSQRQRTATTTTNMLATIQPMMFSPFHSASSSMADDMAPIEGPEPIDLRESGNGTHSQRATPLVKGKSVDILSSKVERSPTVSFRKFSSFDDGDSDDEHHHCHHHHRHHRRRMDCTKRHRKLTHSPRRRETNIVDPVQPFFRRHSNSFSVQKRGRTLKDRTRSFHHSPSSPSPSAVRHSLPPQNTKLHHQAVSAQAVSVSTSGVRRLRTPTRTRPAVKRRSFHFVPSRSTV